MQNMLLQWLEYLELQFMLYQKIWQKWSIKWLWPFMPVSCWSTCLKNKNHEELEFQHISGWKWPMSVNSCNIEKQIKSPSKVHTPKCQINESTRLSFLDFPHTLYLDMSYLISHPTCLFGPTHFAFSPYSFIWPNLFNWHLRVTPIGVPTDSHINLQTFVPNQVLQHRLDKFSISSLNRIIISSCFCNNDKNLCKRRLFRWFWYA